MSFGFMSYTTTSANADRNAPLPHCRTWALGHSLDHVGEIQRKSEIAAPPAEWRHFRFWPLIVLILALALLAAVF
jgi:hypothetical protein